MITVETRSGVIPSPPDERDYGLCMAMEVAGVDIPPDYDVWQPPVENQYNVGSCVAQSLANIMECVDHRDGLAHKDRSVGYIYGTQRSIGMVPREACSSLVKEGDVYRSVFECIEENPECAMMRDRVPQAARDLAKRPLMFVRLHTKEELQRFVLKYQLPVMITATGDKFTQWSNGGRHAVAASGWISQEEWDKTEYAKIWNQPLRDIHYTNSWGTGLLGGNGPQGDGKGYIAFEDIEEIWGVVPMEEKKFTDVKDTRWSAAAIREAAQDGVLQGYEDGTFRPDTPMTREEFAAVYARMKALLGGAGK